MGNNSGAKTREVKYAGRMEHHGFYKLTYGGFVYVPPVIDSMLVTEFDLNVPAGDDPKERLVQKREYGDA